MSTDWAIRLSLDEAALLGKLRRRSGIELCVDEGFVWLRALSPNEELVEQLRTLPGVHYTLLPDGQLVEFGHRVPRGRLPNKPWMNLAQWMNVEVGSPLLGGWVESQVQLRLTRSNQVAEPNVLLTSFGAWRDYALQAPQVRLARLSFAVGEEGQTVIRGTPLPPCAGVRYVEHANIAVEAGWQWTPAVTSTVARTVLALQDNDFALVHADQTWDLIPADAFVRATRSAVRLTMAEPHHG